MSHRNFQIRICAIFILACACTLLAYPAGGGFVFAEASHHPVNFSLLHPVSTNRDTDISTNFRLNLEYGAGGNVSKVHVSGYGYGHGLGLCQCGAIGMARAGYGHEHILTHYYSGAHLEKLY